MAANWTELVIGIIMIISPWVLGFSDITLAKWCNVLVGLLLVIMSSWIMFGERPRIISEGEDLQKGKRKIKNNVEK
jgi:hypothetical protein